MKATRKCLNRCGATLPVRRYACLTCWRILPRTLRTAITTAWASGSWSDHTAAKAAAQAWYDERRQSLQASQ